MEGKEPKDTPSPAKRKPLMQPSMRPRNLDGSFTSHRFLRDVRKIGEQLRAARAQSDDAGGAE